MTNYASFYAEVRELLFGGVLSQSQFDGINAILNAWDPGTDSRWVAYALATAYHETAKAMQPVREIGKGAGRPYGKPEPNGNVYYGRGLVQLTWATNYKKFGELVHAPLYDNPDLALQPDIAAKIMTIGMTEGGFTGRKLGDYFWGPHADWTDARRIINGLDRAWLIAGYAMHFYHALEEV